MPKARPKPKAGPPTVNTRILDDITAHAVDLTRVEAGLQARVLRMLKKLERDLVAQLASVDPTEPVRNAYKLKRLKKLLKQTKETIRTAYGRISHQMTAEAKALAEVESEFLLSTLQKHIAVEVSTVALAPEVLKAIATDMLIDGAPTREWWSRQAGDLQFRFQNAMRQGMAEGEGISKLAQRVRGTKAGGYTDGLMVTSRRHAEMLVRGTVMTVTNRAKEATWAANSHLVKAVVWVATLDRRTTLQCQVRDGLQYTVQEHDPIGHSVPWSHGPGSLHYGCRSSSAPVVVSWDELPDEAKADYPEGSRASMDGQVPETMTYERWLKTKPAAFQDEMLGKTRAKLWRQGKVSYRNLLDQNGRPLTVAELRDKVKGK
jgi:SPP1 gp7 family putative phage head morphogenesis protein